MKNFYTLLVGLLAGCTAIVSAQTSISKPSGTTVTSNSGTSSQWARNGGDIFTVRNSNWSTYKNCVYFGYPNVISSVIDGHNTNGCASGLTSLSFSSGSSNLSGGIVVFTGTTTYVYMSYGSFSVPVRLTATFTDTLGNALSLSSTGSFILLKIAQNFKVKYQLEALNPFTSTYMGAINVFDYNNNSDFSSKICTSISHDDKFYQVSPGATASNGGPYCVGQTAVLNASGGATASSYVWTMTGSGTTFANTASINFTTSGAADKRMKVEVTGILGCKDSAISVVKMLDTAVEADIRGNYISIPDGSTSPAIANGTDFGTTAASVPVVRNFRIHNTGNQAMKLNSASSTASEYTFSGIGFPYTLGAHDSVTLVITFVSASTGSFPATITVSNQDCDEASYNFDVNAAVGTCDTTKEADIFGNYNPISKGSVSVSTTNGTDFGNIVESASATRSFTIRNSGTSTLQISNIALSGGTVSEFALGSLSLPANISAGDSLVFSVTCNPASLGLKFTTVTVTNNDCNEYSYDFLIKATDICNTAREINIRGNGSNIASGTSTTQLSNNTDFGSTILGGSLTNSFIIQNTGTASLTVSGISIGGADPSQFSILGISLPATITGGNSATFSVKFSPTSAGTKTAIISLSNNDCDEGTYTFKVSGASSSVSVTPITKPSGTTITPATSDTRAWAMGSGSYWTFRNSAWKTYGQCTYWGYHDTIAAVINGYNPGSTCSGLSDLYYSSGSSNLASGQLVYTGTTTYYYLNSSGFFSASTIGVKLNINVTDTTGAALSLTRSGSINLLKITKNFRVSYFLQAFSPSNAYGFGGGFYLGAIDLFNNLHTDPSSMICTSINPDQFYQVVTTASATNFGPYCVTTPVHIKATGGTSYRWTGPNSFNSYQNDTTFTAAGFPSSSRFRVEATGILGCKDSAATIVTIRDTAANINLTGNGNAIVNGSTSTSAANNTLVGKVILGNTVTKTFKISNSGSSNLLINSISFSGSGASAFSAGGISLPSTVSAGGNTTFTVTFNPASYGTFKPDLLITNNSCAADSFRYSVEGSTWTCDSVSPVARTVGMHTSAIVQQSGSGWTCYCDSAGKLLLALKLGGTGAVIPDTGVTMKIASPLTIYYPKNTGFIKSDSGFVVWNRTWDVKPSVQPTSSVPVRYFFNQDMVDSISDNLTSRGQIPLPSTDSMYFWKVINTSLGAHPPVPSTMLPDIRLIHGGKGYMSDTTWTRGAFGSNIFSQFTVAGFSGGGGGGGSFGLTPLPYEFLDLTALQLGRKVRLNWYVEHSYDVKSFIVLRSKDGRHFEQIAKIDAANYPSPYYTFDDGDFHADGIYFYQIRQENINAGTLLSKKAQIKFSQQSNPAIVIWPNPTNGLLNLNFNNPDRNLMQIEITDLTGRKIMQRSTQQAWLVENISTLPTGLYEITVRDAAGQALAVTKLYKVE